MVEKDFSPANLIGLIFQLGVIVILALTGGYFFFMATREASGLNFLLYMLVALLAFSPLPILFYRFYGLLTATYILRRDGLLIRWGLRREDIPLNQIEWVRPANELGFRLPLPWLRWPGAILGNRRGNELGLVEFMAGDTAHLILIATSQKVFAISPKDMKGFMAFFQQLNELGSLTPLEAQSVYPRVLIGRVWEDRLARILILGSLGVGLSLLAAVAISIPNLTNITWTDPGGTAPAERLLLLPILGGLIWFFDLLSGIFLYRKGGDLRLAAYLIWGSSALTCLLLLAGSLMLIF
jgi:hypothetical protein